MIGKWIKQKEESSSEIKTNNLRKETPKIMQEDNMLCIAQAFSGDNRRKYATYVCEYLAMSNLAINTIIRAQMIGPYQLEIEEQNNKVYVVCMSENYGLIGIKENSLDGKWIFTVNY